MQRRGDEFVFDDTFGDDLRQGLPPIIGSEGGSAWFGRGGHVSAPAFALADADAFYIGLDVQPDRRGAQVALGTRYGKAQLLIALDAPAIGDVAVTIGDHDGRQLVARASGSTAAARRLLITGQRSINVIYIYEIQPWAAEPGYPLDVAVESAQSPDGWPPEKAGLALGGMLADGHFEAEGALVGRAAEFFLGAKRLDVTRSLALAAASDNPTGLSSARLSKPSAELRNRFRRDLTRLRQWVSETPTSERDLDDASLILYRWLFDKHPLLADVAAMTGVQLWLPGMSDHESRYLDVVLADKPVFQMTGVLGADSGFGYEWRTLDQWRREPAFHMDGDAVSYEAFVKFVRNKLGAGHYDEHDRTRWQRELLDITTGLEVMGGDALVYQLTAIVKAVLHAVAATRLEPAVLG